MTKGSVSSAFPGTKSSSAGSSAGSSLASREALSSSFAPVAGAVRAVERAAPTFRVPSEHFFFVTTKHRSQEAREPSFKTMHTVLECLHAAHGREAVVTAV